MPDVVLIVGGMVALSLASGFLGWCWRGTWETTRDDRSAP